MDTARGKVLHAQEQAEAAIASGFKDLGSRATITSGKFYAMADALFKEVMEALANTKAAVVLAINARKETEEEQLHDTKLAFEAREGDHQEAVEKLTGAKRSLADKKAARGSQAELKGLEQTVGTAESAAELAQTAMVEARTEYEKEVQDGAEHRVKLEQRQALFAVAEADAASDYVEMLNLRLQEVTPTTLPIPSNAHHKPPAIYCLLPTAQVMRKRTDAQASENQLRIRKCAAELVELRSKIEDAEAMKEATEEAKVKARQEARQARIQKEEGEVGSHPKICHTTTCHGTHQSVMPKPRQLKPRHAVPSCHKLRCIMPLQITSHATSCHALCCAGPCHSK